MISKLVANELLAFLQQKLDVMDEVSAIQICSTNFSEEDVAASMLLLYRMYEDFSRDTFDDRRPGMRGPSPSRRYAPY